MPAEAQNTKSLDDFIIKGFHRLEKDFTDCGEVSLAA